MEPEEMELRDALSSAWDEDVNDDEREEEVGGSQQDTEEPVGAAQEAAVDDGGEPGQGDQAETATAGEDGAEESDRETAEPAADDRPPTSWKPAAREHWKALPPEVKAEVARREADVKKVLDQRAVEGQFSRAFERTIAPFQHYIAANGGNPLRSIHNLMATAAMLHSGTDRQKAELVKDIIQNYKVDIETLDHLLAGSTPPDRANGNGAPPQEIRQFIEKELQPFRQLLSTAQQRQQQHYLSTVDRFFNDPKYEFARDLSDEMADLMEVAARRGQAMTLEQAYEKACKLNPEISKILEQRAQQAGRRQAQEELAKKRQAASSLAGGTPGTPPVHTPGENLRDDLEAAWHAQSSR